MAIIIDPTIVGELSAGTLGIQDYIDYFYFGVAIETLLASIAVGGLLGAAIATYRFLRVSGRLIGGGLIYLFDSHARDLRRLRNKLDITSASYQLEVAKVRLSAVSFDRSHNLSFAQYSVWARAGDFIAALSSSVAPSMSLVEEIKAFRSRVKLVGDAKLGSLKAEVSRLLLQENATAKDFSTKRSSNIDLIKFSINKNLEDLEEGKRTLNDEIESGDSECEEARKDMDAWHLRLGRVS
jgi:hypothetical protein